MLGSLWALINTCKWAYLLFLSHGERGGITVRQRQSSRQSVLNLRFAHEWACHLCLPGGAWWGWDKGRTTGWQWRICKVRTGGSRFNSHSFWRKRKNRPNTCDVLTETRDLGLVKLSSSHALVKTKTTINLNADNHVTKCRLRNNEPSLGYIETSIFSTFNHV